MNFIRRLLIVFIIALACLSECPSLFADGTTGGAGTVPIAYVDVSKSSEWGDGGNIVVTIVTRSYFLYPDGHLELLFSSTEVIVVPAPEARFMLI